MLGYLGTFAGSPKDFGAWILAVLLFPVEIISTTARLLSLTVRLWANMFASELIYGIFLSLLAGGAAFGWSKSPVLGVILGIFPATIPVLFLGLHIFVSVVQAYVFTVLPAVYLGLALHRSSRGLSWTGDRGRTLTDTCRAKLPAICRSSVSPAARCPGTTSWRQSKRRQ